jgi:hypothetical protein
MAERQADNDPKGGAAPLPPVPSVPNAASAGALAGARDMAPPFIGRPGAAAGLNHSGVDTTDAVPEPPIAAVMPADDDIPAAAAEEGNDMPWEQPAGDEEGTVEPVFEADVSETTATLAELTQTTEFPLDAFIIPEESQRVPTGLEGMTSTEPPPVTPVSELADRLEKFSHRLRVEDTNEVIARLAAGDRLDALLAGLLAGFIAGTK